MDAAGVAVLKMLGSNRAIMDKPIFMQEQIRRAAELGLGASGPEGIELVTPGGESAEVAAKIRAILDKG